MDTMFGAPLLLLCICFSLASAQTNGTDRITSLPGLAALPSFAMYSGYVEVDDVHGRNHFYFFAESQNNPAKDPLLVWLQGGPGCSSLIGLLMENGPFIPAEGGALEANPFSWNRFANVLWVDSPAGVGFSYSNTSSDYQTDNNKTAADNYLFLQKWLEKFPQFRDSPLWLSGESYAGDYVPQLAYDVVFGNDSALRNQLAGFVIGNPVFSCDSWKATASNIQVELFYWHGLIPLSEYIGWKAAGCSIPNPPAPCNDLLNNITALIGKFDPDDLYTDFFTGNATLGVGPVTSTSVQQRVSLYLNRADVQQALHVTHPTKWVACCSEAGQSGSSCKLNYTNHWTNMMPYYETFFQKAPNLRILIYSGDADIATCPFAYAQLCLSELKRPLVARWRPWTLRQQTAGYVEVYDRYTYATVKGAGHEVPLFQPASALALVQKFIGAQSL